VTALVLGLFLLVPTSALAVVSYVFEPVLSLTGGCKTSALDEVPDPGLCPIPPGTVYPEPGADHPSGSFKSPAIAIDEYGDIDVANVAEKEGRIDVFSPKGIFITEFVDPAGPQSIAVDSKGNVYLFERISGGERQIRRFPPTVYEPLKEEIQYAAEPQVIANESTKPVLSVLGPDSSVAVDASSDQLYVDTTVNVAVFGAASKGNELLEEEAITGLTHSSSITIDGQHEKIYLSDKPGTKFSGVLQEEQNGASVTVAFARNIAADASVNRDLERYRGLDFWKTRYSMGASVASSRRVSFSAGLNGGDQIRFVTNPFLGSSTVTDLSVTMKPVSRLQSDLSLDTTRFIDTRNDHLEFDVKIVRLLTTYQFTKRLLVRNITEHNTFDKTTGVNLLVTYRVNAGTVFFAGYDDRYRQGDKIDAALYSPDAYHRTNRAIFTKLQYLFRHQS